MKIRPLLASAALTFATVAMGAVALPTGAGAATTVQLRFANSSSFNFPNGSSYGLCVDGAFNGNVAPGTLSNPVSVTPGNHDIELLDDSSGDCTSGSVAGGGTYSVPDVASATLILNNPNVVDEERNSLQILPDDLSCPAAGQGRLVVRNGAFVGSESELAIDLFAATGGADPVATIKNVPIGGQSSTDLAPGAYMKARAGTTGGTYQDAEEVPPGTFDIQAGKVTFVFLAGGWDGSPGLYTETLDANCATTPTTTAPTTTVPTTKPTVQPTAAPAATAVATQPTYTG